MAVYDFYHRSFERRGDQAMRGLAFFFGLMFIVEVGLILAFGVDFRYVNAPYITRTLHFGDIGLPLRLAVPFVGSLVVIGALQLILKRSFIGRAIIAVSPGQLALRFLSANPGPIKRTAFGPALSTQPMS